MNIKISSVITVILLIVAFVFAVLGFVKAGDSRIAPLAITVYMGISAIMFAVLAARGLKRREMWSRFLGVAAIVATLYMLVMAVGFYVNLSTIQMP